MSPGLLLPALAALAVGVPAASPHRRLHPSLGARALAVATAALALAVVAAVATVAVGFLSGLPWISEHLWWCRSFVRTHGEVPWEWGVAAVAALAWMILVGGRAWRRARRTLWGPWNPSGEILVVDHDRPDAYAVAGRPGHIVVSAGMHRLLEPAEREVLLAHERSHLRHRHQRYIAVASVATAAVPMLRSVARRLRLAVERWADEDAATEVGDRELVARTIIRAALAKAHYDQRDVLALGVVGVPARVSALLQPPPPLPRGRLTVVVVLLCTAAAVVAGSALQVHHLWRFASHACGL